MDRVQLLREFRAIVAAGRKLIPLGWRAAALDLERRRDLRRQGYPGWLVQSIFLSCGRDFVRLSLIPSAKASPARLRKAKSREIQRKVQTTITALGYGRLEGTPQSNKLGAVRRFSRRRDIDRDWNQVLKVCLDPTERSERPSRSTPIISRVMRSERVTSIEILKAIRLVKGVGGWRPDYVCFRRDFSLKWAGRRWMAFGDLLLCPPDNVSLSQWLQAEGRVRARDWKRVVRSGFFEKVTEDMKTLGFAPESGPQSYRGMIYAGYKAQRLTLKTLFSRAKRLTRWNL